MKNKALKVFALIGCVVLIINGTAGVYTYFKYMLYNGPSLLNMLNLAPIIIKLLIPFYVIFKLFFDNKIVAMKVISSILGICGGVLTGSAIFSPVDYFITTEGHGYGVVGNINVFGVLYVLSILLLGLVCILIFVNTFKPFVKNGASLAMCIIFFIISVAQTALSLIGYIYRHDLIIVILRFFVRVIPPASLCFVSYLALRREKVFRSAIA